MDSDNFDRMSFEKCKAIAVKNAEAAGVNTQGAGTVLLLRPFQTYNMASAILMKGGLVLHFSGVVATGMCVKGRGSTGQIQDNGALWDGCYGFLVCTRVCPRVI